MAKKSEQGRTVSEGPGEARRQELNMPLWAWLVPVLALAFGVASGLGPAAGLYGAIATGIVAVLFGGTPVQITGPTGPMTLVVVGVVATNTLPSGAVDLPRVVGIIVLAGLLQIALGLFRVGAYIRYVP